MSDLDEYPPGWPAGVTVDNLCWRHCEHCQALREWLYDYRDGLSADGQHAALSSFSGQSVEVAD